jgi:uncharacterized protein (DUF433 family)
MDKLDRITFDPQVMDGRATVRGMRVTVSLILNLIANGMTIAEILAAYPYLEAEDIRQALQYGAWLAEQPKPNATLADLQALFNETQALAQARSITEEDIAAEIEAYRVSVEH